MFGSRILELKKMKETSLFIELFYGSVSLGLDDFSVSSFEFELC